MFVPEATVPDRVIKFVVPLTAIAPEDWITLPAFNRNAPFPVRATGPTRFVPEVKELAKAAVLVAVPPTLKLPAPVRVLPEVRVPPSATTTEPLFVIAFATAA